MNFIKPYLSSTALLSQLQKRGMDCSDVSDAELLLNSIGYYRLSGYLYPFLTNPKTLRRFKRGSSLGDVIKLYEFDRELRQLLFDKIERIEVAVRSAIVNIGYSITGDAFWMTDLVNFKLSRHLNETRLKIDHELNKSREEFIIHFKNNYANHYPPSWMIAEIVPLGVLTSMYDCILSHRIKKDIAQYFGLNIPVFKSWMTIVTVTRNICCHHARLWNRSLSLKALILTKPPKRWVSSSIQQGKVFFTMCILKYLIDIIHPGDTFKEEVLTLLDKYPKADIVAMGFSPNWLNEPLWA